MSDLQKKNKRTALILLAVITVMLGLTYESAEFYRLFCKLTGSGGQATQAQAATGQIFDREIMVRFNTDTDSGLPWSFKPDLPSVKVKVGQEALVSFTAQNMSSKGVAGTAIYSIAPDNAGLYFNKTQCFCFNYQLIAPGKTAHFPVVFYIDPKIMKDKTLDGLKTITLSYTFFKADSPALDRALEAFYKDPKSGNKSVPIKN